MDILVLGGGPAGATAAIYAARGGQSVTLVYEDGGALARAERIENYYGFPTSITGPDLFRQGLEQARDIGGPCRDLGHRHPAAAAPDSGPGRIGRGGSQLLCRMRWIFLPGQGGGGVGGRALCPP